MEIIHVFHTRVFDASEILDNSTVPTSGAGMRAAAPSMSSIKSPVVAERPAISARVTTSESSLSAGPALAPPHRSAVTTAELGAEAAVSS